MQKSQTPRQRGRAKIDQIPYTTRTFIISLDPQENTYTHTGSALLSSHIINSSLIAYKCCTAGRLILAGLAVCRANWLRTLIIKRNFYCVWRLAISHAIFHILTMHAIIGAEIECIARHVWARALIIHHFFESTREVMSITLITHCLAQLMWDCGLSFDLFELLCAGQCFFCVYLAIQAHTAHLSREREKRTQHAFFCGY